MKLVTFLNVSHDIQFNINSFTSTARGRPNFIPYTRQAAHGLQNRSNLNLNSGHIDSMYAINS